MPGTGGTAEWWVRSYRAVTEVLLTLSLSLQASKPVQAPILHPCLSDVQATGQMSSQDFSSMARLLCGEGTQRGGPAARSACVH